jgi:Uma2 family endonuclease
MTTLIISQPRLLTLEEYLVYDDGTDTRYELEDGVLVEMPTESPENISIARRLLLEFIKYVAAELVVWGTEVEVSGRQAKVRIPDLLVHSPASLAALTGTTRSTLTQFMPPPALVVEVVSPGEQNRNRDYRYKHTEYAAREISEYWIVDPELQQVTVCQWIEGKYEDTIFTGEQIISSEVVANWQLTVNQIFRKL